MSENDRLCALQMHLEGQAIPAIAEALDTTSRQIRTVLAKFGVQL